METVRWEQLLSRRRFLGTAAAAAGSLAGAGALGSVARATGGAPVRLPSPGASGLEHVVVVMMENRSFDHIMGWLPGADGKQAGLTYLDAAGAPHATYPLAPDFQGCAHADPDHSYDGARVQWNNGACDGWLIEHAGDLYPIGYYRQQDLPFLGRAAPAFTACDRYFASLLGPTFPNRLYLHSGVTDRLDDAFTRVDLPTIWDRLAAAKLPARYYCGNVSFLLLWNGKYDTITYPHQQFFADCKTGKLPALSVVDPDLTLADTEPQSGIWNDDHPHADIRAGEYFLSTIYNAVTRSPAWPHTLLVITFDEWGGFFDHVPPPAAPDVTAAYRQRGFRVPCLLISPFAPRGKVSHTVFDHASILRLVEWRWTLDPLSVRDEEANNLATALDFSRPVLSVPKIAAPRFVAGVACAAS
ncbi:MAG: alkaline phosphatase family protein [Gaiellaceae bacterium]